MTAKSVKHLYDFAVLSPCFYTDEHNHAEAINQSSLTLTWSFQYISERSTFVRFRYRFDIRFNPVFTVCIPIGCL